MRVGLIEKLSHSISCRNLPFGIGTNSPGTWQNLRAQSPKEGRAREKQNFFDDRRNVPVD
jgi:hypothetical protein